MVRFCKEGENSSQRRRLSLNLSSVSTLVSGPGAENLTILSSMSVPAVVEWSLRVPAWDWPVLFAIKTRTRSRWLLRSG
jgi:hypothetical protein